MTSFNPRFNTPLAGRFLLAAALLALTAAVITAISWPGQSSALTFTVTNTNNANAGSLRQAIIDSENNAGIDFIHFNIPGCPPACTITPTTPLPIINDDDTIIDATTEPNYAGVPLVEIDGTNAGDTVTGLYVTGDRVVIQGLVINNFDAWGIRLDGSSDGYIRSNYIGLDATGTVDQENRFAGIGLTNGSSSNSIGGSSDEFRNVISGNNSQGIVILSNSQTNVIRGNYIGTDVTGTVAIGNLYGVQIQSSLGTIIGGSSPGDGNLISGNRSSGFEIGFSSGDIVIQGNLVGTNAQGTSALGNGSTGIFLGSNINDTIVGGTTPGARNVISGNDSNGIRMFGSNNVIRGNYIGTDLTGTIDLGNRFDGVEISSDGEGNIIGGSAPGAGNVISGNGDHGVSLSGSGTGHVIQGNIVGFGADSTTPLGNDRNGISHSINNDAAVVTIGGASQGEGNLVGYNDSGIFLSRNPNQPVTGNTVMYNFIGVETASDALISGNTISSNGGPPVLGSSNDPPAGILIRGDSTDALVQDNIITENNGTGVYIKGIAARIGGNGPDEPNLIANNTGAGVFVDAEGPNDSSSPRDNTISANSIHSNGGLGIDLAPDGHNANDTTDPDIGANRRQNHPVLTQAASGSLTVHGSINTRPQVPVRIEFFYGPECDPAGYGEGANYIGFEDVTTDISGNAAFSVFFASANLPPGSVVTATATHLGTKDTSEFSNCVVLDAPPATATPTPTPTPPGGTATPTPTPTPASSATPTPTPTGGPGSATWADDDCNDAVAATDALKKLQDIAAIDYSVEPGCPTLGDSVGVQPAGFGQLIWGDTDCDGDYDAVDALQILRSIAALPPNQVQPCPAVGESVVVGA